MAESPNLVESLDGETVDFLIGTCAQPNQPNLFTINYAGTDAKKILADNLQVVTINKTLICNESAYFDTIINSFPNNGKFYLSFVDTSIFMIFVEWLHMKSFHAAMSFTLNQLIQAYYLADIFQTSGFKNILMDILRDNLMDNNTYLTATQILYIFRHLTDTPLNPLKKFCVLLVDFVRACYPGNHNNPDVRNLENLCHLPHLCPEFHAMHVDCAQRVENHVVPDCLLIDPRERNSVNEHRFHIHHNREEELEAVSQMCYRVKS